MKTKELILNIGTKVLSKKGYNGFSYADIAEIAKIRKASIHYHFPTKADLCIAIIEKHQEYINSLIEKQKDMNALERLQKIIDYYLKLIIENEICIMGTLANASNTLERRVKDKSLDFCKTILLHTTNILEYGVEKKEFREVDNREDKAIEILSSLMGLAQISRIYSKERIVMVVQGIINQLKE